MAELEQVFGALPRVVHELREYEPRGPLLAAPAKNLVVRGFLFDGSPTRKHAFDVHAYVKPLYVPAQEGTLGLSRWLRAVNLCDKEPDEVVAQLRGKIVEEGLPYLERYSDYAGLAAHALEDGPSMMPVEDALEHRRLLPDPRRRA